ncbi:MAG: hypothetical protein RJA25_2347 [Bacteroidota bacterium]|jgi:hypothetical protein
MITRIKFFLFRLFLRFWQKETIARNPITLQKAKTIGILFEANNLQANDIVLKYTKHLKSQFKTVEILGYVPKRAFGFAYNFPLITDKNVGWYGKPDSPGINHFLESRFDLLINFSTEECLPFEYASAVSLASFRVGFNKATNNANYDLILISKEKSNISNLISNLENYLK